MITFIIFFHLIVASRRKKEENQGLINDILMLKIVMEKRLPRVHQDHHGSNITRPKTSAQQGLWCRRQNDISTRRTRIRQKSISAW
ncbi:unnamed protein product [Spirodela intermedia]|uniref:Uncharacterized protein n=1 Tax=Spirodela intermedia TaxID=51605 RepID=A0A7I8LDD2_SPIIN|nr:unnamed protein product [Spirodela intermedia]